VSHEGHGNTNDGTIFPIPKWCSWANESHARRIGLRNDKCHQTPRILMGTCGCAHGICPKLAYTIAIQSMTPYQAWHRTKPNITHLCEFGAPIWILLQGQNIAQKILPKSKWHAYVGYNDANKLVLYYNAETRKILVSRNYVFLTARPAEPIEEIVITETPREGEREEQDTHEVIDKNKTNKWSTEMEDKLRKNKGSPTRLPLLKQSQIWRRSKRGKGEYHPGDLRSRNRQWVP